MKKILIVSLIFIISALSFSSILEDTFKKALNYSWEGEYAKAEEIFKDLMVNYRTVDVVIAYSNMLAWQEKYQQALDVLYKYEEKNNEIESNKAKVYFWMGSYSKAYDLYSQLVKDGYELNEASLEFYNWYKDYILPYGSFNKAIDEVENLINSGSEEKAQTLLDNLSKYYVNDKTISIKMSEVFANKGDYTAAIGYLQALEPKDCEIYLKMFDYNFESKNFDDAYQNYLDAQKNCTNKIIFSDEKTKFIQWYQSFMKDYENYDTALSKANEFARNKEYKKAEEIYQNLLKFYNTEELILAYSNVLAWQEKYQLAIYFLNPRKDISEDVKANLGKVYQWAEKYDKAYEIYKELKYNNYDLNEEQLEFMRLYEKYYID